MTTDTLDGPRAGRRAWWGFAALLLPLLLVSMDVSVLFFVVPFIAQDLQPTNTQVLWIFDIYAFVLAGLLITMGAIGDRIGRRRLLLIGAAAFGAASIMAAYSTSAEMLIVARALLGVGGATLMPSTLGLVRNIFPNARQRASAVAIWTAALSAGVALGPVVSGVLLENFWWGSVFLINLPAMALLLVSAPFLVPESKNANPPKFDPLSSLLSLAAILPFIYGIKTWASDGPGATPFLALTTGLVMGALFVWRQILRPGSLIDVALFKSRAFSGSIAVNLLAMFAIVGFAVFVAQYLQLVLGMSTLEAALWSLVPVVLTGGVAPAAAAMGHKINRSYIMAAGASLAAVGFIVLTQLRADSPLGLVLGGTTVYVGGLVAVMALVTGMLLGAAPPEKAASAAAQLESGTQLGGALGIALLGSIGAAVYQAKADANMPVGLPSDAVAAAEETLAGATVVAGQLPQDVGSQVLAAARDAFVAGMNVAAVAAACVMVAVAVVAVALLREAGAPEPQTAASQAPETSTTGATPPFVDTAADLPRGRRGRSRDAVGPVKAVSK